MKKQEKEQVVADLQDKFEKSKGVILSDYRGLSVSEINGLRRQLKELNSDYRVAKNTLMKLAVKDTAFDALTDYLEGPSAIAFSYDEIQPIAKLFKEFIKGNEKLELKAAVIDGKFHTPEEVNYIANLPSHQELLSKLLGTMNAVPTALVNVLSGVPRNFVQVLAAYRDKKESEGN